MRESLQWRQYGTKTKDVSFMVTAKAKETVFSRTFQKVLSTQFQHIITLFYIKYTTVSTLLYNAARKLGYNNHFFCNQMQMSPSLIQYIVK